MQLGKTKFVLHGGFHSGDTNEDNHDFYREILKDAPDNAKILLVTFAKDEDEDRISRAILKVSQEFEDVRGVKDISISVANRDDFLSQIESADIVYFHGGVSSKLLEALEQYPELKTTLQGKVVAGESAGANVWCKYFYSRKSDKVSEGLGVLPLKLIPHYQAEYANKMVGIDPELEELHLPEYKFRVFEV